jgi:hypothetical protein
LSDFAAALGWSERDLRAYEPRPLAQAYPAYLAWSALFGTCSGVALAMLANLEEWGGYCGRVAEALLTRYELAEQAVGFFRFFAGPAPGFPEQAASVVAAGLAAGEDPQEAVRAALALHATRSRFGMHSPTALADAGAFGARHWSYGGAAGDADPSRIGPVWRIRLEGSPCRLSSSTQTRATPRFT